MYEAEEKHNKEQFARANEQIKAADEQLMLMNTPEKVGRKYFTFLNFFKFRKLEMEIFICEECKCKITW